MVQSGAPAKPHLITLPPLQSFKSYFIHVDVPKQIYNFLIELSRGKKTPWCPCPTKLQAYDLITTGTHQQSWIHRPSSDGISASLRRVLAAMPRSSQSCPTHSGQSRREHNGCVFWDQSHRGGRLGHACTSLSWIYKDYMKNLSQLPRGPIF